jgi:hypothetical protein
MRSRIWLVLWIVGILFPMAFLGKAWPGFGKVFNATFSSVWSHVLMHTMHYAGLGFLLTQWLPPASPRSIFILVGLSLLVGCLHEGLQLATAGIWPGWKPEVFDLGVVWSGQLSGYVPPAF